MAQYDCKIDWLWVRSQLEEMKYLFTFIFSFLRSGVEAKRDVELRHSTRNASRFQRKVRNGVSLPTAYPAVCRIQRKAYLILIYVNLNVSSLNCYSLFFSVQAHEYFFILFKFISKKMKESTSRLDLQFRIAG